MGIPLIAGREFMESDADGKPKVAIVNEQFAKKFNLGRDAVGKRMRQGTWQGELDIEIVGLVQNAKYAAVKQEIPPMFFLPYRQDGPGLSSFYVRGGLEPEKLLSIVRPVVATDRSKPSRGEPAHDGSDGQRRHYSGPDRDDPVGGVRFCGNLAGVCRPIRSSRVHRRTANAGIRRPHGSRRTHRTTSAGMVLRQVGLMTVVGCVAGLAGRYRLWAARAIAVVRDQRL